MHSQVSLAVSTKRFSMTKKILGLIATLVLVLSFAPLAYADDSKTITDYDDTYAQYSDDDATDDKKRDEHGIVSWLNTDSNNPYHNLIALKIDLGAEFAMYPGDDASEGFIVKCRPGDVVQLPVVRSKPGYTFVGWSQGGVPDEIDWDIFTTEVTMTENAGNGGQTSLYAVYMNEDGDGYCTCGAFKKGVYKDDIERFHQEYSEYLAEHRGDGTGFDIGGGIIAVLLIVIAAIAGYLLGKRKNRRVIYEDDSQNPEPDIALDDDFNSDLDQNSKKDVAL